MSQNSKPRLNLLLIEDVEADAELITYELRKAGIEFQSSCIATKRAFLKVLRENVPDAIISDFTMPQFNALDALHLLQSHGVEVPFILVTGSQSEEVAVECIKEGADDYILKSSLKRLPSALLASIARQKAEREREGAELKLRRSEEYFRTLIDASSDIILLLSEQGAIRYAAPSIRSCGYDPVELIDANFFDLVHPRDLSAVSEILEQEWASPTEGRQIEYRFRDKLEGWHFFESICRNLRKNPAVGGMVVTSRDRTERREAEARIAEQAALLNKAQDAIILLDLEGRISFWNHGAERIYGWKSHEILGQRTRDLLHKGGEFHNVPEAMKWTLERGDWKGELPQVTKDGRAILVESRWSLVRHQDGAPKSFLIINSDITEKKKLETHLLRAQRMESIGTLAGGIAHDLNNVLTPILVSIRLLREETPSVSKDLLETLEASAHRGAAIVQQVLSFARGVEGERAILQVKHPLKEVVKIAGDTFPRTIEIQPKIDSELWPVYGDATQLHQVFMNLFVNARDAMPTGGRLVVEARNANIDENYARMQPDARPGPHVTVAVTDTGTGIPPGVLSRIFEPFFTTKEAGKGTGLGLSTAVGIVRSHGGFMTVYSEVGKGTCFKVHLPAAQMEAAPAPAEAGLNLPTGNGELILVVDDELAVLEIIKVTLTNHGYQVLTASDGTEAVALFATRNKEIGAIIVDIMMPFMDGPATVRALHRLDPNARFLAVSGLMDPEKAALFPETVKRISFLAKPFTTEQLLNSLHQLLQ